MCNSITEGKIVNIMQELVRCPSVNPSVETTECARIVSDILRKNDIKTEIFRAKEGAANVVARLKAKNNGKRLLLNGLLNELKHSQMKRNELR